VEKFIVIVFFVLIAFGCSGCKTQQPVIVDTGNIERLRAEYQQLRDEYDKLQSDYQRTIADNKYYADYYQSATETIAAGTRELAALGASSAEEITKLRSYVAIFRIIINGIIEGQQGEGYKDITPNGD